MIATNTEEQLPSHRPIPLYRTLEEIYPDSHVEQAARWNDLLASYERVYGRKAEYVCRAPGRVNFQIPGAAKPAAESFILIGEHIDYSCFPVLPTAVTADILIAVSARPSSSTSSSEDLIVVENVDERYARTGFTPRIDEDGKWQLDVDRHKGGWVNFVKAGFCGVLEDHLPSGAGAKPMAADLLYTGSVPDGAGLSSSAAMVVGSTLAFLVLNGKVDLVDSGGLVRMAVANERVVGVNSGGMDQAASVLSTASSALLIDFWPELEAKEVPVPKTARFVISNTLTTHNLFETGKRHYNLRVVECSLASLLLHHHLGLSLPPREENPRPHLRHALEEYLQSPTAKSDKLDFVGGLRALVPVVEELFGRDGKGETGWTWAEIETLAADRFGLDKGWLNETFGESWIEVEATHFHLLKRARHVLTETLRVLDFRAICLAHASAASASEDELTILSQLGDLMDRSMASCDGEFDCSSDELNELAVICREEGAIGSRLTGAGWGGCTVSLLPPSVDIAVFRKALQRRYKPYAELSDEALRVAVLESKPSPGAGIYKID